MVVIRLTRDGRKKRAFNHIVVANQRSKRDSALERIGYFDPITKALHINSDRYQYWISQGAQISPKSRVKQLCKKWFNQNTATNLQSSS